MNEQVSSLQRTGLRVISANQPTASFLGGLPKTLSEIDWPRKNNKPLGFIAQLDLGELNQKKVIHWLPDTGRLLFFYDFYDWPWGFDAKDAGGWSVIYEPGNGNLVEQNPPEDIDKEHLAPDVKYVKSEQFKSYPDAQRVNFESLGLSPDDHEEYYDFIDEIYGEEPRHQIGGYPNPIQNDAMEEECQLVSGGVYCGNSKQYNSDLAKKLRQEENDWKLLFQYDSDDDPGIMWGDMGMLYIWVKQSDALNHDFSKSWAILQCC